jgi:hypothetical protein
VIACTRSNIRTLSPNSFDAGKGEHAVPAGDVGMLRVVVAGVNHPRNLWSRLMGLNAGRTQIQFS